MVKDPKLAKEQAQRLTELRKMTHLSGRAFAIKHNISQGSLRNWEIGRYSGLKQQAILQLLKAFTREGIEVSAEWLLYGKGAPPRLTTGVDYKITGYQPSPVKDGEFMQTAKQNAEYHKLNKLLYDAVNAGRYSEIIKLIEMGADLHLLSGFDLHSYDEHENTPLHIAAKMGQANIVKFLMSKGTQVDVRNAHKQTALHWAVPKGNIEIVEFLIQHGANVDAVDDQGKTALAWAANFGQLDVAKRLVACGANVNAADTYSNTPLHWACYYGQPEIIKFLLEKNADVNRRNSEGLTPQDRAVEMGHVDVLPLLIK